MCSALNSYFLHLLHPLPHEGACLIVVIKSLHLLLRHDNFMLIFKPLLPFSRLLSLPVKSVDMSNFKESESICSIIPSSTPNKWLSQGFWGAQLEDSWRGVLVLGPNWKGGSSGSHHCEWNLVGNNPKKQEIWTYFLQTTIYLHSKPSEAFQMHHD